MMNMFYDKVKVQNKMLGFFNGVFFTDGVSPCETCGLFEATSYDRSYVLVGKTFQEAHPLPWMDDWCALTLAQEAEGYLGFF